jgi:hypothetical protein
MKEVPLKTMDLLIIIAVWEFLSGLIAFIGIAAISAFAFPAVSESVDDGAAAALFGLSVAVLVLLVYFGLSIAAGTGLITRKEWGRIAGIIHAALSLVSFPFGTIIGALVIVYLTRRTVQDYFQLKVVETAEQNSST